MALAAPSQSEQRLLVEADQRRLEQAGEIQVVLRQQYEARQRQQVLYRQLTSEIEAIDAGDVDAFALQLPYQCRHQGVAAAHQHHEVPGVQQLAGIGAALRTDQRSEER